MDTKEQAKRSRRRHDQRLKRQVLEECSAAGASVANVALSHGLNANLVHKWKRKALREHAASAAFVPIAMTAPTASEPLQFVELELQRGATSVRVRWPMAAAASCASWLREILR